MRTSLNLIVCVCALTAAVSARAQVDPEAGDMGGGAGGAIGAQPEGSWQPPTGQIPPQGPAVGPAPGAPYPPDPSMAPPDGMPGAPEPPPSDSDHAAVVERFGIGFFGVESIPIMGCDLTADFTTMPLCGLPLADATAPAPTIGVRYWLSETLGIEAALGINVTSGDAGALSISTFGFALHGGVPLALAHSGHFVFQIVPQANFGIATGSYELPVIGTLPGTTSDLSGMLIEVGAKAGAEIHFGFIDVPQLSLQGTVGLMVRHESRSVETISGTLPVVTVEQSQTLFGTGMDEEPWDIFTGSIAAVYYF